MAHLKELLDQYGPRVTRLRHRFPKGLTVIEAAEALDLSPGVARRVLEAMELSGSLKSELLFTGEKGAPPRLYVFLSREGARS
jgi:predicted ArsR family transcriptional regulator